MATAHQGQGAALRHIDRLFGAGTVAGLGDAELLDRFRARRDETAFAALVKRHGPMVLSVCRGVLRDPNDAEDAFQATFWVLARKARSLWVGDSLGGWLHRVAFRVALQANADAARRRAVERQAAEVAAGRVINAEALSDDLRPVLHAEIDRLPDRLRHPLVLCDLEGLTRAQAAGRLHWTEGTVRGRLARARTLLRERLTRRGVGLSAAGLAAAMGGEAAAAVPEAWALAAARAAAAGRGASAAAGALAAALARATALARVNVLAGLAATAALSLGASWLAVNAPAGDGKLPRGPEPAAAPAAPRAAAAATPAGREAKPDGENLEYSGRVVDETGRPVEGARVYVVNVYRPDKPPAPKATTGGDGRFRFSAPVSEYRNAEYARYVPVIAAASGFGPGLSDPELPAAGRELTLRLVADLPIEGRVVDLEGRPVTGATVRVKAVWMPPGGTLDPWLQAVKAKEGPEYELLSKYLKGSIPIADWCDGLVSDVKSDAAGRFRLTGIGRERLAELRVEAPTIRVLEPRVMTRPGGPVEGVNHPAMPKAGTYTVQGAEPRLVASPSRPIEGVVRDRKTGAPIAGAVVASYRLADHNLGNNEVVRTTSDAQGRYRLTGMPRGSGNEISARAPEGSPYLPLLVTVDDPPGLGPVTCDLNLTRGVIVEGRVTDKATGRPVRSVASYHAAADNPNLKDAPEYRKIQFGGVYTFKAHTGDDGVFRCPALPGRGMLVVEAMSREYPGLDDAEKVGTGEYVPPFFNFFCQTIIKVDVPEGAEPYRLGVRLDPSRSLKGTVLDPDGTTLAGAHVYGLGNLGSWTYRPLDDASFKVEALTPSTSPAMPGPADAAGPKPAAHKPQRTLVFQHEGRKLAGWVDLQGDETGPLRVKLVPWGVVTGRVVDREGRPLPDITLEIRVNGKPRLGRGEIDHQPERVRTGTDGRFRIEALAPGLKYRLMISRPERWRNDEVTVTPGETKDLGDVVLGPAAEGNP
jgi:RNA polymerase sigma factor (sigma-70 family)